LHRPRCTALAAPPSSLHPPPLPESDQLHVLPAPVPDLDRHVLPTTQATETPREIVVRRRDLHDHHPRRATVQSEVVSPGVHDHDPPRPPLGLPYAVTAVVP